MSGWQRRRTAPIGATADITRVNDNASTRNPMTEVAA